MAEANVEVVKALFNYHYVFKLCLPMSYTKSVISESLALKRRKQQFNHILTCKELNALVETEIKQSRCPTICSSLFQRFIANELK